MLPVVCLGITSIVFQFVFFREFLSAVSANELILSLLLFNWLLLNGAGALAGRRIKHFPLLLPLLHLMAAILPPVTFLAFRLLRNFVFTPGAAPDLLPLFFFSFVLMAPFCLINGLYLPMAVDALKRPVYIADNLGDLAGGLLFSAGLIFIPNPFVIFAITGLINVIALKALNIRLRLLVPLGAVLIALPLSGLDAITVGKLFRGLHLEYQTGARTGLVRIFSDKRHMIVMENSSVVAYTDNIISAEELAHLALLQRDSNGTVLVAGGGLSGLLAEVRKHEPAAIDYVDINRKMVQVGIDRGLIDTSAGLNLIHSDARRLMERTRRFYGTVVLDLPDPVTLGYNRFYTREFFGSVKRIMARDGILSLVLPPMPDYLSAEREQIYAIAKATLRGQFQQVHFFAGNRTVVIASDGPIEKQVAVLLEKRSLDNRYFNRNYTQGVFTEMRQTRINQVKPSSAVNTDFRPILFLSLQTLLTSQFNTSSIFLIFPTIAALIIFMLIGGRRAFVLFSTGFTVTGAEILILAAFEIYFGTLYFALSLLFTLFLAGLSAGYALQKKMDLSPPFVDALILTGLGAVFLIPHPTAGPIGMIPVLLLLSLLAGYQFARLLVPGREGAAELFSADFTGGALGALLTGILLFPVLGFTGAASVLAAMKFVSLIVSLKKL